MKNRKVNKYRSPLYPNYLFFTFLEKHLKEKHLRHKLNVTGMEKIVLAQPLAKYQFFEGRLPLGSVSSKHIPRHFVNQNSA